MACTAIITDGSEIDQIVEHQGQWQKVVAREVKDLRNMGCAVTTRQFDNETLAYAWGDKVTGTI